MSTYCILCGAKGIPGFTFPCLASRTGSHRPRQAGETRYRVEAPDGYRYVFTSPLTEEAQANGWTLINTITY